jgi:phenylacetate-CoA ligase
MSKFYNALVEKLVLPAGDALLGTAYMQKLKEWRKIQAKTRIELEEMQRNSLDSLLTFTVNNSPFYKGLQIKHDPDPYQWIKNFPIMTKKIIKENIDQLVLRDTSELVKVSSSGSSGVQGVVYLDKKVHSTQLAIQTLWWEWAGFKLGDHILQTGMTTDRGFVKTAKDFLLNTKYIPAYKLDRNAILDILKDLKKHTRKFMLGYASSLYVIAKLAEEIGIDDIYFESVISWGDKMFPHFRSLIEKQFHTTVYDTYGCAEGFMVAAECSQHHYHIMTPLLHLEILDDNGNDVPYGELGNVVVTRLDNYAMPLIRYYVGDLAIIDNPGVVCGCGLQFPLMKKIIGRDTDIVKTRSGKYMIVHVFTGIFEFVTEIRQFRVIQKNLDGIEIEYIKDKGFSPQVLEQIKTKIDDYLQEDFPIDFKEVDYIPPTPSGKPQIIQSFLKQSVSNN